MMKGAIQIPDEMYCPVLDRVISEDLCYEGVSAIQSFVKMESVPEFKHLDRAKAKEICDKCPYSRL